MGWSLATTRSVFEHRAVITGTSPAEFAAGLAGLAAGEPRAGVVAGSVPPGGAGRVVFVFSGHGAQWAGMGRELAGCCPVFAARLAECSAALEPFTGWRVEDVLAGPDGTPGLEQEGAPALGQDGAPGLDREDVLQPVLWAVSVALAAVWQAAGVVPDAVAGHSQGEVAAATVAGILTLPDAAAVIAGRSRVLMRLAGRGGMLSVAEPAAVVRERIASFGERLSVAVVNSPAATVVSGELGALEELAADCERAGVRTHRVPIDYASHSAQAEQVREDLLGALDGITPRPGTVPMISAMTGELVDGSELDAGYWFAGLRSPVDFDRAVRVLAASGHRVFIEVSPHPVLTTAITQTVEDAGPDADAPGPPVVTGTLRRGDGGPARLLASLARAHVHGVTVDWAAVLGGGRRVDLPTYAFQCQRYWPGPSGVADVRPSARSAAARDGVGEALLGVEWARVPVVASAGGREPGRWAMVGSDWFGLREGLVSAGTDAAAYADVAGLAAAVAAGEVAPDLVLVCAGASEPVPELAPVRPEDGSSDGASGGEAGVAERAVGRVLGVIQEFLAANVLADARLVLVTRGAAAVRPGEDVTDLAGAAAAGLVRSAQTENPGRLVLADLPADAGVAGQLAAALGSGEPEVALRHGAVFGRRLARLPATVPPGPGALRAAALGTVLVTGGTGTLGGLTARHLAVTGRARLLLLASRSGPAAPGVAGLAARIAAVGAGVRVAACDAADRNALATLLGWSPPDCPLTGVIHTAGVLDDGVITSLTPQRIGTVMRPKARAAWHLHELTRDHDLDQFVLFSSAAGFFGGPGQGNYAAANAFLDALAARRRAAGLSAVSVAWGLWEPASGMTGRLGAGQRQRMARDGVTALTAQEGLALLDAAVAADQALLVAARLDVAGVHDRAGSGARVPAIWRTLVGGATQSPVAGDAGSAADDGLLGRLVGLAAGDQDRLLLDLVRSHAAAVLGHASSAAVEPGQAFKDLGFDSLTAIELRNRLGAAVRLRLPATMIFDHPSPRLLAAYLRGELLGDQPGEPAVTVTTALAGEPLAIVGMGCRFPGEVRDPEGLWDLVESGKDAISGFPRDRGWDISESQPSYARRGGFVYDVGDFDAGFFGISPREALAMDPQQRLLLEVCWEALEGAGIDPAALRGSATGVFAGAAFSEYGAGLAGEASGAEGYAATGTISSVISGRVSYVLGLEGPAVTVDTACSSSLVALHLACQALRAGECTMALAGGVMVMVSPGVFAQFSAQGGLAADGRCKAFSADADGTGWGEGAGVVVLERLADARRHGHQVLAVVAGSAVNQDGASNGLTAPNGPSQQRVIRAALASAGLSAADVDAVEAHGTGTVLGDPIEAQALLAAYGQGRPEDRPLWLGSVKSNIGHTQAAAGIAGVIKMVLALEHGVLPATLHAGVPSPHVDWSAGAVRLLAEAAPWGAGERPRRAGVSSFGISGTNAHAIIAEAPAPDSTRPGGSGGEGPGSVVSGSTGAARQGTPLAAGAGVWLVSGRTAAALAAQAGRLAGWAAARPGLDLGDVGWSLATTRSVFEHRAVVIGAGWEDLAAGLAGVAAGEPRAGVVAGSVPPGGAGRVVFVFSGHGAQWAGMGRELAGCCPVFAARLAECSAALEPFTSWRVEDVLAGPGGAPDLGREDVLQPVLWAVSVALAAVWQAAGVAPDAVVGHSQGEVAAATVAGMLSLEDAAAVIAGRSRVLMGLAGRGGMLSVAEPAAVVRERIAPFGGRLSVAVVNSPAATVVSGELGALEELAAQCEAAGVRTHRVPIGYASHSAQAEQVREELLGALDGITPRPGSVPMISAMTGELVDGSELDAGYWFAGLRSPVDFERAVRTLAAGGHRVFIEVSPHPVLTTAITQTVEDFAGADADAPPVVTGTLRRGDGGAGRVLASLARVHVHGVSVDWAAVLGGGRRVGLPTYAFQRRRYWPRPGRAADVRAAGLGEAGHPLLGAVVELAGGGGLVLTGRLSVQAQPWLAGHVVGGSVLLPGTAFVELAAAAGQRAGCGLVEELALQAPLPVPGDGGVQVQVTAGAPDQGGCRAVQVFSRPDDGTSGSWTRNAAGLLAPAGPAAAGDFADFTSWPPEGAVPADAEGLADVRAVWRRGGEVFAEAVLPEAAAPDAARFWLHPALLDAVLGAARLAGDEEPNVGPGQVLLPFAWGGVSLHAAGAAVLRARLTRTGDTVSVTAADDAGTPVLTVRSLVLRPVEASQLEAVAGRLRDALFGVDWVRIPAPAGAGGREPGRWAVVGDGWLGLGAELVAAGADVAGYADVAGLAVAVAAGEPAPDVVLVCTGPGDGDEAGAVVRAVGRVLRAVQEFLAADVLAGARLVIVTRGAAAVLLGEDVADLAGAAAAGLVRSAQSEHPGRLVLADLPADAAAAGGAGRTGRPADAAVAVGEDLAGLLAATLGSDAPGSDEPEVALRDGAVFGLRLARLPAVSPGPAASRAGAPGTVLVTGGTGALGGLTARHLAATGRARQLLLASRTGPAAPGAAGLAAGIAAAGAAARVAACDASDKGALAALLGSVPQDCPLTGVIHTAGVLDDGVITSLTPARVEAVLRAKAAAAWHLHELTRERDLTEFVLFSSAAGVLGSPGQGNYAAGNAFLNALAARRRSEGLPAVAVAWGPWEQAGGMAGRLGAGDLQRMARGGVGALAVGEGLALLDAALAREEALLVAARMDVAGIRARAVRGDDVPNVWRALAGGGAQLATGNAGDALRRRLAGLPGAGQDRALTDLVRSHVAAVLGHTSAEAVEPGRAFRDLGFDSLTAVELRNRLGAATGLKLPATVIFDYATPAALAGHLRSVIAQNEGDAPPPVLAELDKLESMLSAISAEDIQAARIMARLESVISKWKKDREQMDKITEKLESSTDAEIFDYIGKEFGIS